MKRWGLSLAAVATISVFAALAIIQSQRQAENPAVAGEPAPSRPAGATAANPLRATASSAMRDPFARPVSATIPAESPARPSDTDPSNGAAIAEGPAPMIGPSLEPRPLPSSPQPGRKIEPYAPPQLHGAGDGTPSQTTVRTSGEAVAAGDQAGLVPRYLPGPPRNAPTAMASNAAAAASAAARRSDSGAAGETAGAVPTNDPGAPRVLPGELAAGPMPGARPDFPAGDRQLPDPTDGNELPSGDIPPMPGRERLSPSPEPGRTPAASSGSGAPVLRDPIGDSAPAGASGDEGTGRPGAKQLEGLQAPQLQLQKFAPAEVQVGKPAVYRIAVRNVGTVPAAGVEIRDTVPKGMRLLSTTPRASRGVNGEVVWTLGTMKPGDEVIVELQLIPIAEGELGSTATVHFTVEATARSIATKPQLTIDVAAADRVLIGDQVVMQITVSNTGSGAASGVVIEAHLPAGLQHPAGADLEHEIGALRPGETRQLDLALTAVRPGPAVNILGVRGEGNLRAETRKQIEVTAPQLELAVDGPKKRYLEREASYQISLHNPGTAPARKVELLAQLPPGLKFVGANNAGYYDEASRTVVWRLEELPVNETGAVELVTLPVEAGQHALKLRTAAERGAAAEKEHPVLIEGLAAIHFQAADTIDPVEVNGETTYEIRVVNQGSKAAGNVRLNVQLPVEMKPLAADGPSRYAIEGSQVVFEPLARLAPKADAVYRVRVQALRPGDLRTRIQLTTDDMQTPVVKEESTRVYADE